MLFPNTHRNHMLPMMCSQPEGRNIDVPPVHQCGCAVMTQRMPCPSGTAVPGGTERSTSPGMRDRKSTRLNSSHDQISYAVFCLKKKKNWFTSKTILSSYIDAKAYSRYFHVSHLL